MKLYGGSYILNKKIIGLFVCLLFVGVGFLPSITSIKTSISDTIIVPDDYPTIQGAINNANPGDTVFVRNGIYNEGFRIREHKPGITVSGEDKNQTIINKKSGIAISVYANNTKIEGFTINTSSVGIISRGGFDNTTFLYNITNLTINDIYIKGSTVSVHLQQTNWVKFENNIIEGFLDLELCNNYSIKNNTIRNMEIIMGNYGVVSNNILNKSINIVYYSDQSGISIGGNFINISHNIVSNKRYGISIGGSSNVIWKNKIINNGNGTLLDIDDTIIHLNNISNNDIGIYFFSDNSNNVITNNNFINNSLNVLFLDSSNNKYKNNYWGEKRFLPYPIFGYIKLFNINIPWYNFDWNPAKQPYDI